MNKAELLAHALILFVAKLQRILACQKRAVLLVCRGPVEYKQRISQDCFVLSLEAASKMTLQGIISVAVVCHLPSKGGRIISALRCPVHIKET